MPSAAELRQLLEQHRPQYLTGCVAAAVHADGPVVVAAYGRDAEGVQLADDSLFPFASITKLATALAILRLVDDEQIELDGRIGLYIPDADAQEPSVTVRALLTHTAGMKLPEASNLDASSAAWETAYLQLRPSPELDGHWMYSNAGYDLLGLLAQRITGRPWREALQVLVLEPLGIHAFIGEDPPQRLVRIAAGPGGQGNVYAAPDWPSKGSPNGGLIGTASAALALVRAFAGMPEGFLAGELLAQATSNQVAQGVPIADGLPAYSPRSPWGFGPEMRGGYRTLERRWPPSGAVPNSFGHSGDSGALVWFDPPSRVALALLSTCDLFTATWRWDRGNLTGRIRTAFAEPEHG